MNAVRRLLGSSGMHLRLAPILAVLVTLAAGCDVGEPESLSPGEVSVDDDEVGLDDVPAIDEDEAPSVDLDDEQQAEDPSDPGHIILAGGPRLRPGCVAKGRLGGSVAWIFFTRPQAPCVGTAGSGRDYNALDELTRLIRSVPAGGRIDGHIFSITVDSVARALLEAQQRGVAVWLSTDGQVAASKDPAKTQYLDRLVHKVYCTSATGTACVGAAAGAISHTKLFTFSSAAAPDGVRAANVVWFGSANQTYASGMDLYNNTVTVYGNGPLYSKLRGYLVTLHARNRTTDYYDAASARGYLLTSAADVYVSPEVDTDLIVNRLNDVTVDASCRVRVMHASIRDSRLAVVDQLVRMKRAGCKVWVAADFVGPAALTALRAAGIPVHRGPIHDKAFLVYGKFGTSYAYRVYTGSHNLSVSANRSFDEIFVKLAPERGAVHPVYDAYYAHFNDAYNRGPAL
jgi:hypothetical protein